MHMCAKVYIHSSIIYVSIFMYRPKIVPMLLALGYARIIGEGYEAEPRLAF